MASAFRFFYKNICCGLCCLPCKRRRLRTTSEGASDVETGGSSTQPLTLNNASPPRKKLSWSESLRRVMTTSEINRVSVPIHVSLLLIAGYIVAGALLFTFWEKDWDFFIGCYFTFITLTTIGFGDYVPGASVNSWNSQEKLVSCALYLIVGLSLIAMCFDLMQAEVKNMCKALARKMGILKDEESDRQKSKRRTRKKRRSEKKRSKLQEEYATERLDTNIHCYPSDCSMPKHLQVAPTTNDVSVRSRSQTPSIRLVAAEDELRRSHDLDTVDVNQPNDVMEDSGKVIFIDEQRTPLKITIKRAYETQSEARTSTDRESLARDVTSHAQKPTSIVGEKSDWIGEQHVSTGIV